MAEDEDRLDERLSTRPSPMRKADVRNFIQTTMRLHKNDHHILISILKRDGMTLQKFISIIVRAYIEADPGLLKAIKTQREIDQVAKENKDECVFSMRERLKIYDEIEKDEEKDE